MPAIHRLPVKRLAAVTACVALCTSTAAALPPLAALRNNQPTAGDGSIASGAWVVGVVGTNTPLVPATLLGLRPDEVVAIDADHPQQAEAVAEALQQWGAHVVLVFADSAEDGRLLQQSLIEQCHPLREALMHEGAYLELVTVDAVNGTFMFRGPHPQAAELIRAQAQSVVADLAPAEPPEATLEEGEAVLASSAIVPPALESVASLPALVTPIQPAATLSVAPPVVAALPAEGESGGGTGGGNLGFALLGLLMAAGVVVWSNRSRLFPEGVPALASWMPLGPDRLQKRSAPAAGLPGPRFHSTNARLTAAVNRLYDKLQQKA